MCTFARTAKLVIGANLAGRKRLLKKVEWVEPHLKTARTVRGAD